MILIGNRLKTTRTFPTPEAAQINSLKNDMYAVGQAYRNLRAFMQMPVPPEFALIRRYYRDFDNDIRAIAQEYVDANIFKPQVIANASTTGEYPLEIFDEYRKRFADKFNNPLYAHINAVENNLRRRLSPQQIAELQQNVAKVVKEMSQNFSSAIPGTLDGDYWRAMNQYVSFVLNDLFQRGVYPVSALWFANSVANNLTQQYNALVRQQQQGQVAQAIVPPDIRALNGFFEVSDDFDYSSNEELDTTDVKPIFAPLFEEVVPQQPVLFVPEPTAPAEPTWQQAGTYNDASDGGEFWLQSDTTTPIGTPTDESTELITTAVLDGDSGQLMEVLADAQTGLPLTKDLKNDNGETIATFAVNSDGVPVAEFVVDGEQPVTAVNPTTGQTHVLVQSTSVPDDVKREDTGVVIEPANDPTGFSASYWYGLGAIGALLIGGLVLTK